MFAATVMAVFTPRPDVDGYILFEGLPIPTDCLTAAAIAASVVVTLIAVYAVVIIADARHMTDSSVSPEFQWRP